MALPLPPDEAMASPKLAVKPDVQAINAQSTLPLPQSKQRSSIKSVDAPSEKPVTVSAEDKIGPAAKEPTTKKIPSTLPPPVGFTIGGDVNLFGLDLPARLYKQLESGEESGFQEHLHLHRDGELKELIPGLNGSHFGEVKFQHGKFVYNNKIQDADEEGEVSFSAAVHLEGVLEHVRHAVEHVFGMEHQRVHISGVLGKGRDWKKPLMPNKFSLKGELVGGAGKGIFAFFTNVGFHLHAHKPESPDGNYHVGVEFFGDVLLDLLGSGPIHFSYTMKEENVGKWTMRIGKSGEQLFNTVGFKGLTLSDIEMVAHFPIKSPITQISFDTKASLDFAKGKLLLQGSYDMNSFSMKAEMPSFTLEDLCTFYSRTTKRKLEAFDHHMEFRDMTFYIDNTGLKFSGDITIDGHKALSSSASIKRDGILIKGSVHNMRLGDITVTTAELYAFIGRTIKNETSRETGFSINGKMMFHNIELDVGVYTLHSGGKDFQWTVYGELQGMDVKLSRLCPDVDGTWLDIELTQVAFIASNVDSPEGSNVFNVFDYPIKKGIQFCAAIDRLEPLDNISKGNVHGLVLQALWLSNTFDLKVILPIPIGIHLTKNIVSGPVSVELLARRLPAIRFTGSLDVISPRQSEPLVFTFGLEANMISAKGFGQMTNYWVNPFGIHKKIKIGPNLALDVGIIYAVFASSGAPSSMGFSGGMAIGDVEAQVAVLISENPADELIKASLSKLSVKDLVKFASEIYGENIPLPPEDLFSFRDILLYLSTGISVGTTYYPPGVSMKGEMQLFGKTAKVECTLGATTKIMAEVEKLQIGPLTVCGSDGKSVSTVVELGASTHVLINGSVEFLKLNASVYGVFDILPAPNMAVDIRLAFAEALEISLGAKVVGLADFTNLHEADLTVDTILEQHILEYLVKQVHYYFTALLKFLKHGIEAAHEFIHATHEAIESTMCHAAEAFDHARRGFEVKEAAVLTSLNNVQDEFEKKFKSLEKTLFHTKDQADKAVFVAHKELEKVKIRNKATATEAAVVIRQKKLQLGKTVNGHLTELREVKEKINQEFGDVKERIEAAEIKADEAKKFYDKCNAKYEAALQKRSGGCRCWGFDLSFKTFRLRRSRNTAMNDLKTAKSILSAALDEHPEFASLDQAKEEKKKTLRDSRTQHEKSIVEAESNLSAHLAAEKAEIEYHESVLSKKVENGKKLRMEMEKELITLKGEKEPIVEKLKAEASSLSDTEEFRKLKDAETKLKSIHTTKIHIEATKTAVENFKNKIVDQSSEESTKGLSFLERLMEKPEELLNIERIELRGSLRDLLEKGKPLDADVRVVVGGKVFDIKLGFGVVDVTEFVKRLLEHVWEVVKDAFEEGEKVGGKLDIFGGGIKGVLEGEAGEGGGSNLKDGG